LKWQSAVIALARQVPEEAIMAAVQRTDDEQAKLWNSTAGCAWVEAQALLDRTLQPFEDLLVAAVAASGAQRVLDVGCGTGSTTRAIARLLGAKGQVVGIDISAQMIDAARMLAEQDRVQATFICDDAQTHAFAPAGFDMIVARFGTMFFKDPVQAFANLRQAAAPDAQLCFIAWRSAAENPFMTAAESAAAPLLPNLQPRVENTPGPFGLADAQRMHSILAGGGWADIDIRPIDVPCTLPEKELTRYGTRFGPVGTALRDADPQTQARVAATVRAALDPFVQADEARFTACCWMVVAR
jgi:SAM-dependent methyltransferase